MLIRWNDITKMYPEEMAYEVKLLGPVELNRAKRVTALFRQTRATPLIPRSVPGLPLFI